jgi:hypothetical protein
MKLMVLRLKSSKKTVFEALEVVEVSDVLDELLVGYIPAAGDEERSAVVSEHNHRTLAGVWMRLKGRVLGIGYVKSLLFFKSLPPGLHVVLMETISVAKYEV